MIKFAYNKSEKSVKNLQVSLLFSFAEVMWDTLRNTCVIISQLQFLLCKIVLKHLLTTDFITKLQKESRNKFTGILTVFSFADFIWDTMRKTVAKK